MSRYTKHTLKLEIAYGYDRPLSSYFFQVFDKSKMREGNEEGLIIDESFLTNGRMLTLMNEYKIDEPDHLLAVAMDSPF